MSTKRPNNNQTTVTVKLSGLSNCETPLLNTIIEFIHSDKYTGIRLVDNVISDAKNEARIVTDEELVELRRLARNKTYLEELDNNLFKKVA